MKKVSRRNFLRAVGASAAITTLAGLLGGCGASGSTGSAGSTASSAAGAGAMASADVVNIGSTGSLSTLNPLMVDATWINMYAAMLQFNPLVVMNEDGLFDAMLADRIETEDNLTYTIHIDDAATWSDGQPVTADDLAFTLWALSSSKVANLTMYLGAVVGTDDETGFRPEYCK